MNTTTEEETIPLVYHANDNRAVRSAVRRILCQDHLRVEDFETGDQMLEDPLPEPDLVLLDVDMPGRDGFQICQEIRRRQDWANSIILLMSACFTTDQARVKGLEDGADGYLTWPTEGPVLVATIRAYLRLRSTQRALALAQQRVTQLTNLLPICSWCSKIRDEDNSWKRLDHYLSEHSKARFSHGVCPDCMQQKYGIGQEDKP